MADETAPLGNYMTPGELRAVADYCEALRPLWDALTGGPRHGVSLDIDVDIRIPVYDSNGETLGVIAWSESGPAFYANTEKD